MEGTRENRLAILRAQKEEEKALTQRDNELGQELSELQNEALVQ